MVARNAIVGLAGATVMVDGASYELVLFTC